MMMAEIWLIRLLNFAVTKLGNKLSQDFNHFHIFRFAESAQAIERSNNMSNENAKSLITMDDLNNMDDDDDGQWIDGGDLDGTGAALPQAGDDHNDMNGTSSQALHDRKMSFTDQMQALMMKSRAIHEKNATGDRPKPSKETILKEIDFELPRAGWFEQQVCGEEWAECTFKPDVKPFRFSRPRGAFLDEVEKDIQGRLNRHEVLVEKDNKKLEKFFHPKIGAYSSSLQFEKPVHDRLHECYGTQMRRRLEIQAAQLARILATV